MCGVVSIFAYGAPAGRVDREELVRMRDHMSSRGPDGEGEWYSADGRVGMGHRRLAIIDPRPEANQPFRSTDGSVFITYNGEIYNFRALRAELEGSGYVFRTSSDTEVLVALYQRDDVSMFTKLRGMYAFVLWDSVKRRLLLARDPFGIKPLYYADDGRTMRVASQVKALLAGGGVSTENDPAAIVGFLLFGSVPEPFTWKRAIRSVPAGSYLSVDASGPQMPLKHFALARIYREMPRVAANGEQLATQAFRDSIEHHLVSDVPVGAFLSAGVDSGAIVGLMRDCGVPAVLTSTVGFDEYQGTSNDETPLADGTARRYGADHRVRRVDEAEFHEDLSRIIEAMDQPSIDGVNTWFAAKACAERGLKVALSGVGGDELLGGYPSFRSLPRWIAALRWGRAAVPMWRLLRKVSAPLLRRQRSVSPKLAGMLELGGTWEGAYLLRRGLFMPWDLVEILPPDMLEEGLERLDWPGLVREAIEPDAGSDFARVACLESDLYMRNQLLRDTDWASMAHSLEVRTPWVDSELVRSLAPLVSWTEKGHGKSWLAHAPSNPLSRAVANRPKTGFGTPVGRWAARAELLQPEQGYPRVATQATQRLALGVLSAFGMFPNVRTSHVANATNASRALRVHHFQRKAFGSNFSVERIFADVRTELRDRGISVLTRINRHHSKGLVRRVVDAIGASRWQGDVNHVTGDIHYVATLLDPGRTVLTVLDCVTLHRLKGAKRAAFWFFWYLWPTRRCRYITVISEFTKSELLREVSLPQEKIVVIPPSLSREFRHIPAKFDAERPRILQIGTNANKNLERVIEALTGIRCLLTIVGPLTEVQRTSLKQRGIEYEAAAGLDRDELLALYAKSDMVVFASTYEGFGLPIIEANAVGRPVVTSNICSMPEVANGAARLVDPYDINSIREGILHVVDDQEFREELVTSGLANAKRFALSEIARKYMELYEQVYSERWRIPKIIPAAALHRFPESGERSKSEHCIDDSAPNSRR